MERDLKYTAFVKNDFENNKGRIVNCCEEMNYMLHNCDINEIVSRHMLTDILTYATRFTSFYKKYSDYKCLQDFPIMTKQDLKDHWDEIIVKEYAEAADSVTKYTSGSTGTPFKMVMDKYKHSRWIAGNKVFREYVGIMSHEKTFYISGTVQDKKIPMERQERDNVYYLSCKYFDDLSIKEFVSGLEKNNVRTVTAMASCLDMIANMISRGELSSWKGDMIAIISVSEHLKENTRKVISEYFGCPVYALYANEENGVFAVEDGSENGFRVNNMDFYLEVLSLDSDEPVKEGEIGRLVITDLYNKAFPIIRYANGDLVSMKHLENGRVYFTEIAGRKIDVLYTTDGRPVHYFEGISFLEPYTDIKQFQLIQQTYHDFVWKLNTQNHSYEDMIIQECKTLFGEDSNWTFEYVDEIPKLRSGKTRMTVCNIPGKNN